MQDTATGLWSGVRQGTGEIAEGQVGCKNRVVLLGDVASPPTGV